MPDKLSAAGDKRPMTVDDLYRIISIEDPQISPDGEWIAFVRVTVDRKGNGYKRNLWISATSGSRTIQLTYSDRDTTPRWSPDGTQLLFVSARSDKPQLYVLPIGTPGGEAKRLTDMPNGATGPAWSPDGTRLAFLSAMNADERAKSAESNEDDEDDTDQQPPADELEARHRKERQEEEERRRRDPLVMWRIPYRAGTEFLGDRYSQVFVMDLDGERKEEPRLLTDIDANHEAPQWSPDGSALYTARQTDVEQDEPFRHSAIYRIDITDGSAEQLTGDEFRSSNPMPSRDGQWLAYIRIPKQDGRYGLTESTPRLALLSLEDGSIQDLNRFLDRSPLAVDWTRDSKGLVFSATNRGTTPLYHTDLTGKVETLMPGDFKVNALTCGPEEKVAFAASTPFNPSELHLLSGEGDFSKLTTFNDEWLNEVIVQETHKLNYQNPDGQEVQGWYLLPVGYQEGKKYPLALNIHGGPHFMWGPSEATMFHEWQMHAARGYVVFYCNPRGSSGYGQAFLRGLHGRWGEAAQEDVMAGVDAVLKEGFVDEERMAITGGSYGGYLTAWILGHSNRFKSAVAQRGVYNLSSFYGTSDIPSLISIEFGVEPWEDHALLWQHSPLAHAHKIKTPLLIIHAENDYRVPIEQAEQLFAFVRRSGGQVQMLRYPRDGHELSRSGEPEHRVSRLTEMVAWFDEFCMPNDK
jgi:dipeptidyl aminopeptidase/acylaminoacyl peptidase